jgi:hypothetical protein
LRSQITHQPMQRLGISRQCGEIDLHTKILIPNRKSSHEDHAHESISRRLCTAVLCRSTRNRRPPPPLWRAPVDAVDQHR